MFMLGHFVFANLLTVFRRALMPPDQLIQFCSSTERP
jgi:hypothetical protein